MFNHFFRDGGWGMYPTMVFGFLLVASGVALILRPERRSVLLTVSLAALTMGAALLGLATGLIATLRYATANGVTQDGVNVVVLGCAESLNNLVLGLLLFTITALLAAVAAWRASRAAAKA